VFHFNDLILTFRRNLIKNITKMLRGRILTNYGGRSSWSYSKEKCSTNCSALRFIFTTFTLTFISTLLSYLTKQRVTRNLFRCTTTNPVQSRSDPLAPSRSWLLHPPSYQAHSSILFSEVTEKRRFAPHPKRKKNSQINQHAWQVYILSEHYLHNQQQHLQIAVKQNHLSPVLKY